MSDLDWSTFDGPKRNPDWKPDDQDLIYTAINFRDDEYGDADDDAGQQIAERLLTARKLAANEIKRLRAVMGNEGQQFMQALVDEASAEIQKRKAAEAELTRLRVTASHVIASASDTYKKRNGHLGSFEDDSGEKCWIVPFDAFESLRSAVDALKANGSSDG